MNSAKQSSNYFVEFNHALAGVQCCPVLPCAPTKDELLQFNLFVHAKQMMNYLQSNYLFI